MTIALLAPSFCWAAPTKTPTAQEMSEARRRYDRALELSDEGNYDEALLELQRAYALAPTYRLLYNLGVVSVAVHDYVKAIDYFNRYLIEGGTEIDAARATEVQTQIERLRARTASVKITVSIPNADVSIDDVPIGKSPIGGPVTVNSGRHRVSASLPGYFPATQVVELAGNDNKAIALTLVQATVAAEKPSKPIPWLAWGITAALGAGAVVTGVLALNSESNYDSKVGTLGVSGSDVDSSYRTMRGFSVTCDVLLVATVVAAGVSVYLTVKPVKQQKKRMGITLSPSGFTF
jgi:hypothetical protein